LIMSIAAPVSRAMRHCVRGRRRRRRGPTVLRPRRRSRLGFPRRWRGGRQWTG
jgi:hypothetical protein